MKNILIIEDDEFLRGLIKKKLDSEGFEVVSAADGEEGVKKAKDAKPDLVLLDLILPNMDGYEVLSKIRDDKSISSTPVIILSNLGQQEDIEKATKLGASDYIIKAQSTPEEIVEKVKTTLK